MGAPYFQIVTVLAVCGMCLILSAVVLEIVFAIIPNSNWNEVLTCKKAFPRISGDDYFGGLKLDCPPQKDEVPFKENLPREADHEYAFVLLVLILIISLGLYVKPIYKKQYRGGNYTQILVASFGVLGLFCLPAPVMISFNSADYHSNFADLLNKYKFIKPTMVFKGYCYKGKDSISLCAEAWQMIAAKCVLNDGGGLGQTVEVDPDMRKTYSRLKNDDITFGSRKLGYRQLQKLGFCPYADIRLASLMMSALGILCFWAISCSTCFFKYQPIAPDETSEQVNSIDEEQTGHPNSKNIESSMGTTRKLKSKSRSRFSFDSESSESGFTSYVHDESTELLSIRSIMSSVPSTVAESNNLTSIKSRKKKKPGAKVKKKESPTLNNPIDPMLISGMNKEMKQKTLGPKNK